jgi:N-acetylmuramoyl-L-alanine amidase
MRIAISSGHGKYVRGASGLIDEVDEARKVVDQVATYLLAAGVECKKFHDDQSKSQSENLNRITDWHNKQDRDYDVSVHFNAYQNTNKPMGTECLYVTQSALASQMSDAISEAGQFIDRGPKKRTDLHFLNATEKPAILIETCFVDSSVDVDLYKRHFFSICRAITRALEGEKEIDEPEVPTPGIWHTDITATVFGNPGDEQEDAYGGWIDGDTVGVALPYKWRDSEPPEVIVEGPKGQTTAKVKDVGPWNTDDPDYVLGEARPLAEIQYDEGVKAQNGQVPTNNAGIDLTVPVAEAVGIEGKGKVRWRLK